MPAFKTRRPDDLLIVIRQDGDLLLDDHAKHEIGSLLHSQALGITIPAMSAVPVYSYVRPDGPPVQVGMGYIQRQDPKLPHENIDALNYMAEALFEGYETESTGEQVRAKERNQKFAYAYLILAFAFALFSLFIYPLLNLPSDPEDEPFAPRNVPAQHVAPPGSG